MSKLGLNLQQHYSNSQLFSIIKHIELINDGIIIIIIIAHFRFIVSINVFFLYMCVFTSTQMSPQKSYCSLITVSTVIIIVFGTCSAFCYSFLLLYCESETTKTSCEIRETDHFIFLHAHFLPTASVSRK